MSKTVTMDRAALDAFCAQWPCHGFPEALDRIVFEFADNGDLVDVNAYTDGKRVLDSADFDGGALAALCDDARQRDGDEPVTPVIFRVMNKGFGGDVIAIFPTDAFGGDVIAIFPTDASSYSLYQCGCYAHVGQHSSCEPHHIMHNSRPATPAEYADLKAELEGEPYGYRFKVYNRLQTQWQIDRQRQLYRIGARVESRTEPERVASIGRLCRESA